MYDGLDAVGVDQQVNIKSYNKKCVEILSVNHYLSKYCKQSPSLCVL